MLPIEISPNKRMLINIINNPYVDRGSRRFIAKTYYWMKCGLIFRKYKWKYIHQYSIEFSDLNDIDKTIENIFNKIDEKKQMKRRLGEVKRKYSI